MQNHPGFRRIRKTPFPVSKRPGISGSTIGLNEKFFTTSEQYCVSIRGRCFFTELKQPDWSHYFVQASPLLVDYLKEVDTYKLIDVAGLSYPQEVKERIYHLTVGHPTLVQKICYEMVTIANTGHRKTMTMADLDNILEKTIYRPQNGVTEVFWGQFCREETVKTTVRQVINGQQPTGKKALFKLTEHGFVIKRNGEYHMRVPIFEEWVKQLGDVV